MEIGSYIKNVMEDNSIVGCISEEGIKSIQANTLLAIGHIPW